VSTPIVVDNISKRFGSFEAVRDVTFTAPAGAITALLGPSGSGKSTVLRMIAGLEEPNAGKIFMGDEELTVKSVQERQVGFVFQHYALFRHMSVRDNVAFGLRVRKETKQTREDRVEELLDLVQLTPFAERYPDQLSGGQRQRVALGRALAVDPRLLLLDEPMSNLDYKVRIELRHELRALQQRIGITAVYVTHDREEALTLADRIAVLDAGRVEQYGPPEEIFHRPKSAFVAGFMGADNALPMVRLPDGNLMLSSHPGGEPVTAHFRSDAARVGAAGDGAGDRDLRFEGSIAQAVYVGQGYRYRVRVTDGADVWALADARIDEGTPVTVAVPRDALLVFARAAAAGAGSA